LQTEREIIPTIIGYFSTYFLYHRPNSNWCAGPIQELQLAAQILKLLSGIG
jgi:hypothetical protein